MQKMWMMETERIAAGEFSGMFVGGWWMGLQAGETDKWRQTKVLRVATPLRGPSASRWVHDLW